MELCAAMPEGGTTPSFGTVSAARRVLNETLLHVIIRPRGGDFLYSPLEQEIMLRDIAAVRQIGADGVVFGCLTAEGDIDISLMRKLIDAAAGMDVTFHRAFDMCRCPVEGIEHLISLGVHRVLTSGQAPTAEKGIPLLRQLVEKANGRIVVMPGCGVNASNIRHIARETGAREFHLSGRGMVESGMTYRTNEVTMGSTVCIEDYRREVTDRKKISAAMEELAAAYNL